VCHQRKRTARSEPIFDHPITKRRENNSYVEGLKMSEQKASPRVVIIGSGIAALAAAQTLMGAGIRNVTMLEGRNRIGGRIYTDLIGPQNVPVNLGAHFIHGCEAAGCNILLDFCRKHKIRTVDSTSQSETYFTGEEPGSVVPSPSVQRANDAIKTLDEQFSKMSTTSETLRNVIEKAPEVCALEHNEQLVLEHLMQAKYAYAAAAEEVSVAGVQDQLKRHHHHRVDHRSCGQRILPFGFGSVIQHLGRGLARCVRFGETVTSVAQGSNQCVVCTAAGRSYTADVVIVTVPLGVLKARAISFQPALPAEKLAAIDRLGFGVQNRIYLTFESTFWDRDVQVFGCCRDTRFQFFNMAVHGLGSMLSVIVRPPFSQEMEKMDDDSIIVEVLHVLQSMFPDVPAPTSFKISRWGSDQFARGSFSYIPTGASMDDVHTLAKPEGLVYFAGEATSDEEMQMARGAFTSGIRAAGEVLKLFGREEQAQVETTQVKVDQAVQSATPSSVCEPAQQTLAQPTQPTQPTQDVLAACTPRMQPNMPNMMMAAQPWAAWMPGMPGMPYYMPMPYPANMPLSMPMSAPTMMPMHAPAMMPGASMPYYPPMMMYPYFPPTFNPSA